MSIVNSNYTLFPDTISCSDFVQANLTFSASPDIVSNPADIVLLLDCSGSMYGTPLAALKVGVKQFLSMLDVATDNQCNGEISGGSRVGIVTFSNTATQATPFLSSTHTLYQAVDAMLADGATNHACAFETAVSMLETSTNNQKIIVMFTDGQSTVGGSALAITDAAKAQGIAIYCIVLKSSFGTDIPTAALWVTQPASSFLSVAPNESDLEELFADLAKNIIKTGASNIHMSFTISDAFSVLQLLPSKGNIQSLSPHRYIWHMDALGETKTEEVSLQIKLQHTDTTDGQVQPITKISYQDAEQHVITFPLQSVSVHCPYPVEPCPKTVSFCIEPCQNQVSYDLGNFDVSHFGTILECSLTLRQVCPHHRIALALILTETDHCGHTHPRGFQTFTIPAHHHHCPKDIVCNHIRFILPALPLEDENWKNCKKRNLHMQVLAHNIDTTFYYDTE